jgi:phosphodiesterase/alkaline phosphatase D-like protein
MKIVAASCANLREVNPQRAWPEIRAEHADVLLLLGDNVYLERDDHTDAPTLAAQLRQLYGRQFADPGFAAVLSELRARGGQLVAIYDDHDFIGDNRCGADCSDALRRAARAEFVAAFKPVQTGEEVYHFLQLGAVDLVVLDERFYRHTPADSGADPDAMLGAAQWAWFEAVVNGSTARYLLVASSTTFHAFGDQSWEQYPSAFERMRSLLRGRLGALIVSGDAHRNAVYDESGVIEIVTSGVAQRSRAFGCLRQNFGVLDFGDDALSVDLRSLKIGSRFRFTIPRDRWRLP